MKTLRNSEELVDCAFKIIGTERACFDRFTRHIAAALFQLACLVGVVGRETRTKFWQQLSALKCYYKTPGKGDHDLRGYEHFAARSYMSASSRALEVTPLQWRRGADRFAKVFHEAVDELKKSPSKEGTELLFMIAGLARSRAKRENNDGLPDEPLEYLAFATLLVAEAWRQDINGNRHNKNRIEFLDERREYYSGSNSAVTRARLKAFAKATTTRHIDISDVVCEPVPFSAGDGEAADFWSS